MGCCSSSREGISYIEYIQNIRPLDLILFRGNDAFSEGVSLAEQYGGGTSGQWTHCGLIVTNDMLPFSIHPKHTHEKFYVWESTLSASFLDGVKECVHNTYRLGVQVRCFSKVLHGYLQRKGCQIAIARLRHSTGKVPKLAELYEKYNDVAYEYNIVNTCYALACCAEKNTWDNIQQTIQEHRRFFCSQFVAQIYSELGILDPEIDPAKLTPDELLLTGLFGEPTLISP